LDLNRFTFEATLETVSQLEREFERWDKSLEIAAKRRKITAHDASRG
jgi:hypothetical protein